MAQSIRTERNANEAKRGTTGDIEFGGNMYFRIKNQLDAYALMEDIRCEDPLLADRIGEIAAMCDANYSGHRSSRDMGGYLLFFPTKQGYDEQIGKILNYYHLDRSLNEYEEIVGERAIGNIKWHEKMWLLSSDDALVCIFPEEVGAFG